MQLLPPNVSEHLGNGTMYRHHNEEPAGLSHVSIAYSQDQSLPKEGPFHPEIPRGSLVNPPSLSMGHLSSHFPLLHACTRHRPLREPGKIWPQVPSPRLQAWAIEQPLGLRGCKEPSL